MMRRLLLGLLLFSAARAEYVCPGPPCSSEAVCTGTDILFCEDWEAQVDQTDGSLPGWDWNSGFNGCTSITNSGGYNSANALRQNIPTCTADLRRCTAGPVGPLLDAGASCTLSSQCDSNSCVPGCPESTAQCAYTQSHSTSASVQTDPIFMRLYLRFSPGYKFMCTNSQKIAYLRAVVNGNSVWRNMIGLRAWITSDDLTTNICDDNNQGRMIVDNGLHSQLWTYGSSDGSITGAETPIVPGNWYCVEWEMRGNSPGQSNGYFNIWLNDQPFMHYTGVNLNSTGDPITSAPYLSNYYGGDPPPQHPAQSIWYDQIVTSRSRIGCNGTVTPSATEFYVQPSGSNSTCDGTTTANAPGTGGHCAWASPTGCITRMRGGDTCFIMNGTYTATPTSNDIPFWNVCDGPDGVDAANPTEYKAYPGHSPKFCINANCDPVGSGSGALLGAVAGAADPACHHITFDGLRVDGGFIMKGEPWAGQCGVGATTSTTGNTDGGSTTHQSANCYNGDPSFGNAPERLFYWTATGTGTATATTCGSSYDTLIYVLDGTGTEITPGGCCDDSGVSGCAGPVCVNGSTVVWQATEGVQYTIVIDGYKGRHGAFVLQVSTPSGGSCLHDGQCSSGTCDGQFVRVTNIIASHNYFEGGFHCDAQNDYGPVRIENVSHVTFDHNIVTGATTTGCSTLTAPGPALLTMYAVHDSTFDQNTIKQGSGADIYSIYARGSSVRNVFSGNRMDREFRLGQTIDAGYPKDNQIKNNILWSLRVPVRSDGMLIDHNVFIDDIAFSDQCSADPYQGSRYYGSATNVFSNNDVLVNTDSIFGKDTWGVMSGWSFRYNNYDTGHVWRPNKYANSPGACNTAADVSDSALANWITRLNGAGVTGVNDEEGSANSACTHINSSFSVFEALYDIGSGACLEGDDNGEKVGPYSQIDCVGDACGLPAEIPGASPAPPHRSIVTQ